MSTFKWEISEPTDDPASEFQGGTVQLDDLKAASPQWRVQPPEASVELAPQVGGEVDLTADKARAALISKGVLNFVVVVLTCVLGFIVIYDSLVGELSFKELIGVVGPLVVALKWRNKKTK